MLSKSVTYFLLLLVSSSCLAQSNVPTVPLNAQPNIAPHLLNCYRNPQHTNRDNRLPMTPELLIELIRRVEDSPGFTQSIQQFTPSLLHRFKQDGIIPASIMLDSNAQDILRYSTHGFNFQKHRVLLTRLIPGNGNNFPNVNGTLNEQEQCALHFMLSTSIETRVRGDEGNVCGRLAQYRSVRVPRNTEDVEMMKTPELANVRKRLHKKFGRYQQEDGEEAQQAEEEPAEEAVEDNQETDLETEHEIAEVEQQNVGVDGVPTNAVSQCPVENGVLQSPWGAFSAGTVIAGIAAGLEIQQPTIRELIGERHMEQFRMARQTSNNRVDNRFAATLSGDIAEAVLRQVPLSPIRIGASGAWNNSAVPRWYFLSQREHMEMTDAEIRGGIDGLVMGSNIALWRRSAENMRLSQVLDMYYSQRGMFGRTTNEAAIRACNRRNLFTTVAPLERLQEQAVAFTTVLDGEMQTQVTLSPNSTQRIASEAARTLNSYIAGLNDLACAATQTIPNDDTIWRTATDILIFVEIGSPFNFRELHTMIGHLLNNMDVGRFGSSYTILNANDGQIIVNTTNRLSNFYSQWTLDVHNQQPLGLNLPNVLNAARTLSQNMMNNERLVVSTGGRSHIALIVAQQSAVNEEHTNFVVERMHLFREELPDLRFIYWASGSFDRFNRFVREPARDLYPLRIDLQGIGGDSIPSVAFPVLHRIQQEPRRIINHRCGADWNPEGENQGTTVSIQYVEPRGVVFYRLQPNYFFHAGGGRRIRIKGSGFSSITVCQSRSVERPRANNTSSQQQNNDVVCQNINTDTIEIDLSNACDGHGTIHQCPPLFISMEGTRVHDGTNLRCTERDCRFPDNARFEIVADNLGCFSSVANVVASIILVLASVMVTIRF